MSSIFDSMGIDPGIIIIILLILTLILLANVLGSKMRLSRLERKYKMFMKAKEDHEHDISFIKHNMETMFSKYGIEKYDAFDDVGGKLSFALALLDKDNTGLILNAVHSRDNCFLYLKEIVKGESYVVLSQEEVEALRKAVNFGLGNLETEE